MAGVQKFEDLIAWQKARILAKEIYQATNKGEFARDFGLRDQIRRAAVSVMSNIAEGFERKSPADFMRFLLIAKASCAEVRSQLYLALDISYIEKADFDKLSSLTDEVSKLISAFRRSIDPNS
jgi:four helix bundle protein